jgi:hypothetical protein
MVLNIAVDSGTVSHEIKLQIDGNTIAGFRGTGDGAGGAADLKALLYENTYFSKDAHFTGGALGSTIEAITLGAGATTFAVDRNVVIVTGDAGGNTIATITGGIEGQTLTLLFVDGLVTISNDDTHGADTVDLDGANNFVSADDKVLTLIYDGTSWYKVSESAN